MKLYDAPLVAERALEVFGGLEKARMGIRARQVVADAVAARREQVVADMALRSAEAARRTMPRTAPERLCVSLDIAPQTSITQTKAMETFNLEKHHLYGVAHQTKVGAACRTARPLLQAGAAPPGWENTGRRLTFDTPVALFAMEGGSGSPPTNNQTLAACTPPPPPPCCAAQPNPRNPRWSPMKLYKAADVAEQAIRFRTVSES